MATIIRIKRSSNATTPSTLKLGEMKYAYGTGTAVTEEIDYILVQVVLMEVVMQIVLMWQVVNILRLISYCKRTSDSRKINHNGFKQQN